MENANELTKIANEYLAAFDNRNKRFKAWTEGGIGDFVKSVLTEIKDDLQKNVAYFTSNIYVGEETAQMETDNRTLYNQSMRTLILRSGAMPVSTFKASKGSSFSSIIEEGFQIRFNPMLNGKIHVFVYGHHYQGKEPEYKNLEVVDDPQKLTKEKIQELVSLGLTYAKTTSFLFL